MTRQLRRHTNAPSTFLLFLGLSSSIPATIAHPLAPRGTRPSATTSYKIAIGFTIAISLIIFSAAVFYLGRRRERTQTWFCWRDPVQSSEKNGQRSDSSFDYPEPNRLKTRISFPKMIGSSAPVELSSPVDRKPKYLELQGEIPVYEMGEPSPKQRRSGTFFQSMEQGIYANSQNPEKSARDDVGPPVPAKNEKYSPDVVPQTLNSPPAYPRATYMGRGRSTRRSSVMDWSGLEYVKRIYASKSLRRTS